ncbi:HER231Cp [Eremothecium sinecaudum]|uniref:HER231Cp n=1 Tax=Eremothecium sinecaudum TaxID=45286 RepID=A0A0X8HU29_9SACH|nr:HER231Cp [Eremothecium sinecaudum]AMD21509.1 HER231Cp [Eremothecium sinecaudum]
MSTQQKIDLSTLNAQQLAQVKQQFDQELQHFHQSLQALNMARNKFRDCISHIKLVSQPENENQELLVPLSASLYAKGKVVDHDKFMVDVGTGYYVEKNAKDAIEFYQKKVEQLTTESGQIQKIIEEKTQSSIAIENLIRSAAIKNHGESAKAAKEIK